MEFGHHAVRNNKEVVMQSVVIGVLRDAAGKFLVAQRRSDQFAAGLWEFPGGRVESGEGEWQALCRELSEEVGLVAQKGVKIWRKQHQYSDRQLSITAFWVQQFTGEAVGREGQLCRWVAWADLNRLAMPAANADLMHALETHIRALAGG
jgi:8-oxo-dGTP diphosphatase